MVGIQRITPLQIAQAFQLLGALTACALLLAALWCVVWIAQEVVKAVSELARLLAGVDPIIITACVFVGVLLLICKGYHHEKSK